MESAWPRTMAASRSLSRRGGSGNRTLPPASPGRSAANDTSRSPLPAIAFRQTPTARLIGSVGASLLGVFDLMLEDITSAVIPGRAEGANPESIFTILAHDSHDRGYGSPLSRGRLTRARH